MSEATEVTEVTGSVKSEDGSVEANANLDSGIKVAVDTTPPETPEIDAAIQRVKDKYNNDIDKIAEAYRHAEKKISEGQYKAPEAPEEYKYNFAVEGLDADLITPDDPLLAKMTDVFRENKLPQDVADSLVNAFLEYELEQQPKLEDSLAELGKDGQDIIDRLENFAQTNLEADEREAFDAMTFGPAQVKLLHKMINMAGEQKLGNAAEEREPLKSAQEYIDEAFAYRDKHADTIGWNKEQHNHYMSLMAKANSARK